MKKTNGMNEEVPDFQVAEVFRNGEFDRHSAMRSCLTNRFS